MQLSVHHGRGLGAVRADPGQLEQVIINLAVNARDAMPGGGTLTIETYPVSAADVRQMGNEFMPPADYSAEGQRYRHRHSGRSAAPKSSNPFSRPRMSARGQGWGCRRSSSIIKQSAGFIFADSKPGAGTNFTIYLPVHRASGDAGDAATGAPADPAAKAKKTDGAPAPSCSSRTRMVRAVAERALTRAGYTVVTASQGEEGLERFAAMDKIDLVISDVVMPC